MRPVPLSTLDTIDTLTREERWSGNALIRGARYVHSFFDRSLWIEKVDLALIGGDPLLQAERVIHVLRAQPGLRIAIIDPGLYAGQPLAALDDLRFREIAGQGEGDPDLSSEDIIRGRIDLAAEMLRRFAVGGVFAREQVQAMRDPVRDELVLRMTRHKDRPRRRFGSPRAADLVKQAASDGGKTLYDKSRRLHDTMSRYAARRYGEILDAPPEGRRYADIIIAQNCELLSGFLSGARDACGDVQTGDPNAVCLQRFGFTGSIPVRVREAVISWGEDFRRARNDPIFEAAKGDCHE